MDQISQDSRLNLPYRHARRVSWGDCDPAGVIYTPRVLDYVMEVLEGWVRDVVGVSWLPLNRDLHMGMPTVRVELDFMDAPAPDDEVVTEIRVRKVGRASLTSEVLGRSPEGKDYFRACMVSCFVERPAFKSMEIPLDYRARILAYQAACGDGEPES